MPSAANAVLVMELVNRDADAVRLLFTEALQSLEVISPILLETSSGILHFVRVHSYTYSRRWKGVLMQEFEHVQAMAALMEAQRSRAHRDIALCCAAAIIRWR